jgi:RNA polymerase sigma-70 factor (ECF subfamily)
LPRLDTLRRRIRDHRHARLLAAARGGSESALVRLYGELYDPVADYLERRCATPQDAEDLIATVFHRFLQNLVRFDPRRGCVLAWVLTMARHAFIDHLRATRPAIPVDELDEVLAGPAPDPLEGLVRTEQADRLGRALAELPAPTREMLELHYAQGLRLREIGDLVGLSEDAVKQRFSRVRRTLRERLRDETREAPGVSGDAACRPWQRPAVGDDAG